MLPRLRFLVFPRRAGRRERSVPACSTVSAVRRARSRTASFSALLALGLAATLFGAPVTASAQAAPFCPPGQSPTFVLGFRALAEQMGETMGEPLECEHPNPENGDSLQRTTTGLAYYRRSINTPVFTDGRRHWALTERGFVTWTGGSIDPPPSARLVASLQAVLPTHRIVSYYGNPLSPVMGVLGEPPVEVMLARLREQAAAYEAVDPSRPVLPALELIATVAQAAPGADGLYRARMDPALIEQVAQWAESNDFLLILDVQPGLSSVAAEVEHLVPYLRRPYVHLALDPEFNMAPHQAPGQQIGSMDAAEINQAIAILADIVEREQLPPKVLIVHRFLETMVTNHHLIQLDPRVQVVIDMDGFGSPAAKVSKYNALVRDQPVQYAGIKLFYQWDAPVMPAEQIVQLTPPPDVVIYQ